MDYVNFIGHLIVDLDNSYEILNSSKYDDKVYSVVNKFFGLNIQNLFNVLFEYYGNNKDVYSRPLTKDEVKDKSSLEVLDFCFSSGILIDEIYYKSMRHLFELTDIYMVCESKLSFYREYRHDFIEMLETIK